MKYQIRLAGAEQDDGSIGLQRLAILAQTVSEIATGALNIRIAGYSSNRGKLPKRIANALDIKLSNIKTGSTILELECETFDKTLIGQQGDVFRAEVLEKLPSQTPMALVIEAFGEALDYNEESNYLDKNLLKKLKSFEKVFRSKDERIIFSNNGSIPELILTKPDFRKINFLEESIPDPHETIINGVLDELKFSKSSVSIVTNGGLVNGILSEDLNLEEISKYWGKQLTIVGTAHYKPGGKIAFIIVKKFFESKDSDNYFSRKPNVETVEQQIQRQLKDKGYLNQLNQVIGKWPGDEDFENLLQQLDS